MGKNKKIYKIPLFTILIIIILAGSSFFILRSPSVQTWLFERLSERISKNNDIELQADEVRFTFFNQIEINNLLLRDNTSDTMLYAPRVKAGIRRINRKARLISLGRIELEKPIINLRPDTNNILNLAYLGSLLTNQDTARRNKDLLIRQIVISDGELNYNSGKGPDTAEYFDINNVSLTNLHLTLDNLDKHYSDLAMRISELSLNTDQGFEIQNMFTEVLIADGKYYLLDPTIRTSRSFINSEIIGVDIQESNANINIYSDASLNLNLQSSIISLADLAYFIEPLRGMDKDILFSGRVTGSINELNGRNILLSYSDSTMLSCDFDLSGLPDIDDTFMFIQVNSLTTTAGDIAGLDIPGLGSMDAVSELSRLGAISFSGNFTGFIEDFVTYGTINTELGSVTTDILFRPDTSSTFYYKGTLEARSVGLGRFLDREDILGNFSAYLDVEGTSRSFKNFRADIEANIGSIEFNKYNYRDLNVSGLITDKIWDGTITSNTEDLKMDLLGRFDFTGQLPEVDFSLNLLEADLYRLNINPDDSLSNLSMLLTASFTGNSLENITGDIRLLNSRLTRNGDEFDLYDCSISAFNIDSTISGLNLRTDYVDADIEGIYNLSTVYEDIKYAGSLVFPSLIDSGTDKLSGQNDFKYEIRFKNTDRLNEFFNTGFLISPEFSLNGKVKPGNEISLLASGDYLVFNNNSLTEPEINCLVADSGMKIDMLGKQLNLLNRTSVEQFSIKSETQADTFNINLIWENTGIRENRGTFMAEGNLTRPDSLHTRLELAILPADIVINDRPWYIGSSQLIVDSTALTVNRFMVRSEDEYFMIDGKVSEDSSDSINISFNGLNLAGLNSPESDRSVDDNGKLNLFLEGLLNGDILLTDVYNNLMFETDVTVENFRLNEQEHGDVKILSEWDNSVRIARINVSNDMNGKNTFKVGGGYDPSARNLELLATVDDMPLDILNLFLKSFASEVDGMGSGSVEINSNKGVMSLYGSVMAEQASMTVDYLQSNFRFSDSIRFDNNKLLFSNIQLRDNKDNRAVIDGYISHRSFKDFIIDLRIDADNTLVLDTRQKDNSLFYGTAYASGVITITGPSKDLNLNISAQTERNTRVFIPLGSGEQVSDYTFITFREEGEKKERIIPINLPAIDRSSEGSISLNFELEVTPDAEVQLVFDSKLGDAMKARGTGTLYMALDDDGDFTIFGDYLIEDGEYQLTLGNIFNKRFIVEEGGTITWNGDIIDANVDARAIYKLKASLEDLFQDEAYSARIPVECHLNMSGQLINPIIGFDIYLPTADESMRTDLRAAIDSEEEMSRQFLYLLVMNSFYPDPAVTGASLNTTNAGASAMGVTTTEMLSNQLSNWLSQISNDFDIGFAYRPGNEISSQEVEVALSTQLLNDRVVINGNFDVGGETGSQQTSSSTTEITGDFDVEVKITERIRFKVFNRSNDNMVYETAPYTQGFGLFFRQSFDSLADLFRKKKSEMKREEEPEIIEE